MGKHGLKYRCWYSRHLRGVKFHWKCGKGKQLMVCRSMEISLLLVSDGDVCNMVRSGQQVAVLIHKKERGVITHPCQSSSCTLF
jgi:hypothetical protein